MHVLRLTQVMLGALVVMVASVALAAQAGAAHAAALSPCRISGVETEVLCGRVKRLLDPEAPAGTHIEIHYAVLPALARNKHADPVFFFAGGPGQSAIEVAGTVARLLARVSNRRDIVLVDQRGTGRSAPLHCDVPAATATLRESVDLGFQERLLATCLGTLRQLPHGDMRHYTTPLAMQDADAVREALGAEHINLVGASYGTRAALEYQRQFPARVRRMVLDGVAPPDMALPAAFSIDNQAALEAVLRACEAHTACTRRYPDLRVAWRAMLQSLPREVSLHHPVTGAVESVSLTRDTVLGMVRQPLYVPALAAALPLAIAEAATGRFDALMALGMSQRTSRRGPAQGMHFAVVCAEDAPRLVAQGETPGADFGPGYADFYRRVCASWPHGRVPAAFYTVRPAPAATLVLSGGDDPATPPRHGERVTRALGAKARHVVVPHAGHGVMGIGCMRDVLFRFIDAESDELALAVDAACVAAIPRPPLFLWPQAKATP